MADFDPDAFLKETEPAQQPFDPDAFLKETAPTEGPSIGGFVEHISTRGFYQRIIAGATHIPHDTAEIFNEGVAMMAAGPGQIAGTTPSGFEDTGPNIEKELIAHGASPEEAKREAERIMQRIQTNMGLVGPIMGAMQAVTAPLFGIGRGLISRPIEEATGFPKEGTDLILQTALAAAGLKPHSVARVKVNAAGEVRTDVIGQMPLERDFKTATEVLGGDPAVVEANLRRQWEQDGVHPAEALENARNDAWERNELTRKETDPAVDLPEEAWTPEALIKAGEEEVVPSATPPPDPPITPITPEAPSPLPGRLMAGFVDAGQQIADLGKNLQMLTTPMVRGSAEAMATVKDFANRLRRNNWEWSRIDDDIVKRFTPEQRERMWVAADEESVLRQEGKTSDLEGFAKLTPDERAYVEDLQARSQMAWLKAVDLGMVEGEGLPSYAPRVLIGLANSLSEKPLPLNVIGENLTTRTAAMKHRQHLTAAETEAAARGKYGEQVEIARDIRVLPHATAQLENAIAGRTLIKSIQEAGRRTGEDTVSEGSIPDRSWFTLDHPAFRTRQRTTQKVEIPAQKGTGAATHETSFDPGLQSGLDRVAKELGITIKDPLTSQDPYLSANKGVLGYTSRAEASVVSRFGNAQTVLEHEIGHKIDFKYDLSRQIYDLKGKAWRELGELALLRVDEASRAKYRPEAMTVIDKYGRGHKVDPYVDYLLNPEERMANLLHAYWYAPKLLEKVAPNAMKWFEKFLKTQPDSLKEAIKGVEPSLQLQGKSITDPAAAVMSAPTEISVSSWKDVPIYVRGDYEGPLRAVLDNKSGKIYQASMAIKGKTMGLIMNSPLIHNAVEWGRAMPALPGKVATFKIYFEGNAARRGYQYDGTIRYIRDAMTGERVEVKGGSARMAEAIDNGLVPIGKRFFNQDITSIMETPNLEPGRSLTAKTLALVPDLFSETAGTAVKRAIDTAGDFWHNTLLWDRIADLQMGLYTNFQDSLMAKGVDRVTAARTAAHWANRYAGALPKEAMSNGATKISNFMMFSRSFTLGNLGVLKDMVTGLPKDVLAQIERDGGFKKGAIEGAAPGEVVSNFTKGMAQRKAITILALDIGLMYVMNSLLQNMSNIVLGDSTIDEELQGYSERLAAALQERKEHPLKMLQVFDFLEKVSATSENEPNRQDRVKIGHAADGTAVYGRNPVGKIGEEFMGYMFGPLDMMRKKMGTIARPAMQVFNNDAGFSRKVYNPNPETVTDRLNVAAQIAWHMFKSQFPETQIRAGIDLVKGDGDAAVNKAQLLGPLAGFTFSRGAPGGEAVGEMYAAKSQHDYKVQMALPDIRKQIVRGDTSGARQQMMELGIPKSYQQWIEKTSINPSLRLGAKALKEFELYATPEQKERLDRARARR